MKIFVSVIMFKYKKYILVDGRMDGYIYRPQVYTALSELKLRMEPNQ